MKRIDSVNARPDANGPGKPGFHDNEDLHGQDATYLTPDWANAVQEEIANVIEFADLELDEENNAQLLEAIQKLALRPLQNFFAVGSWHGTDNLTYDPATALEAIFGYRTKWRLRPYAPYGVNNLSEALLAELPISGSNAALASRTRIWKRLRDDYEDPIFALSADKTNVDEGQSVTVTLTAQHVEAGTAVAYVISGVSVNDISLSSLNGFFTVDANGEAQLNINILADQRTEITETMKVALLDSPGTFVNITINDTSRGADVTPGQPSPPQFYTPIIWPYSYSPTKHFNIAVRWANMEEYVGESVEIRLSGTLMAYLKEYWNSDWNNPTVLPDAKSSYTVQISYGNPNLAIRVFDVRVLDTVPTGTEFTLQAELWWNGSVRVSQSLAFTY